MIKKARYLIAGGCFLVASTLVAGAQPVPYYYSPYYQPYPVAPALIAPPAWSYDPYTSGLGPCPQRRSASDPPCSEEMQPTYGQPNYWR